MSSNSNLHNVLEEVVGDHDFSSEEPEEVADGEVKETWVYGNELVVQHVDQNFDRFARGARMYQVLDDSSVPVPEVIRFSKYPHTLLTEFVEGESPQTEIQYRAVGQELAGIHNEFSPENYGKLDYENPNPESGGDFSNWKNFLRTEFNSCIQSVGHLHDTVLEFDVRDAFNSHLRNISDQPSSGLLHYDLDLNEVAVQDEDVQAFFDWDEAIAGDPDYEFVQLRNSISDSNLRDAFTEGYNDVRSPDIFDSKENAYLIHDMVTKCPYFDMLDSKGELSQNEIESQRSHLESLCGQYLS